MLSAIIGAIPFILLFAGLAFTKARASRVAAGVLLITLVSGWSYWKAAGPQLLEACLEGVITALLPIVWVVFGAVYSYAVSSEAGAIAVIQARLTRLTDDRRIQAVLVAFCFGGFLEAIAGFGTAVAIPSSMLVSLNFAPVPAILISLVANSVPVAFGALGIPVIALARVTQLPVEELTQAVVLQLLPFAVLIPVAIGVIADRSLGVRPGQRRLRDAVPELLLIGAGFCIVQLAIAFWLGPELVAVGGAIGGFLAFLTYQAFRGARLRARSAGKSSGLSLWASLRIYALLLALVVLTRIAADWLNRPPFTVMIPIGEHGVKLELLSTPGTLLLISTLIGGLSLGVPPRRLLELALQTARKIRGSALTIILILMISKVMSVSGMVTAIALSVAALVGKAYPLLAPALGALGTFVTGSDTSSNLLLGELQKQSAIQTGFSPVWISAANTSGATAGKMISPQSIQIAASVVGVEGEQGKILRISVRYCMIYLGLAAALVAGVAWLTA